MQTDTESKAGISSAGPEKRSIQRLPHDAAGELQEKHFRSAAEERLSISRWKNTSDQLQKKGCRSAAGKTLPISRRRKAVDQPLEKHFRSAAEERLSISRRRAS
jgi:hypothetical protein